MPNRNSHPARTNSWHAKVLATGAALQLRAAVLSVLAAQAAPLDGPASLSLRGCRLPSRCSLPDIVIAPGERVALIGPTVSSETSALRILAGRENGPVMVAGQPLKDQTADGWRARPAWMPQAQQFLTGSLAQYLRQG